MNSNHNTDAVPPYAPGYRAPEITIAQLVGQVYEAAPAAERCRILEHLMQPLGALSLVAVANGVFAKLWFRSGWHELHIQPDDALVVRASDVVSLMDYVQQASVDTIDGLAQLLATTPVVACSAAAAVLLTLLARRAQTHETGAGASAQQPKDGLKYTLT